MATKGKKSSLAKVELYVEPADLPCAEWILKQNPRRVAEALSLCEAACSALHHQLSSEEIQHHVQKEKKLQQRLETARISASTLSI